MIACIMDVVVVVVVVAVAIVIFVVGAVVATAIIKPILFTYIYEISPELCLRSYYLKVTSLVC